jgi:hypothetical protein
MVKSEELKVKGNSERGILDSRLRGNDRGCWIYPKYLKVTVGALRPPSYADNLTT